LYLEYKKIVKLSASSLVPNRRKLSLEEKSLYEIFLWKGGFKKLVLELDNNNFTIPLTLRATTAKPCLLYRMN